MCQSASTGDWGVSINRIRWAVPWNSGSCYFGHKIEARIGVVDSVITSVRSGWIKFSDLVPLLASGLPLGSKGRLHSTYVRSATINGSESWPVKEEDLTRLN